MSSDTERISLTEKKALMTEVSKDIGVEKCTALADAGADIASVARDQAGLAKAADNVVQRHYTAWAKSDLERQDIRL
ncbi:MAG: hypothetical protein ACRBM6_27660 [Geminicoccales bacterium]